jgi:hypothetical protein
MSSIRHDRSTIGKETEMDLHTFTVLAAIAPVVVACHYYRQTQNRRKKRWAPVILQLKRSEDLDR